MENSIFKPYNLEIIALHLKALCLKPTLEHASLKITPVSEKKILSWSHGQVKNSDTINYRDFRPAKDGLFCERIFGPTKDYECACGKYKRIKFAGRTCERCGVEVTSSDARRERMGHISLAAPVVHLYFQQHLADNLGMPFEDLEKIAYYDKYVVIEPGKTQTRRGELLGEKEYCTAKNEKGFKAEIGAKALEELLKQEQKPAWMILKTIPVLPPNLRPLVPFKENGELRFASSDLNDLYRRVVNRAYRVEHLKQLKAPAIVMCGEQRMLQEAVDNLFWNGFRKTPVTGVGNRPLKGLTHYLQEYIENFWRKNCDFSGEGIVISDSSLNKEECALPEKALFKLYKPLVMSNLSKDGFTVSPKELNNLVKKRGPNVDKALKEALSSRPLLLTYKTKATSLKSKIKDIEGVALNPETCVQFGFKMQGEKINFHLPIAEESVQEAYSFLGKIVEGDGKIESTISSLVTNGSIEPLIKLIVEEKAIPLSETEKLIFGF